MRQTEVWRRDAAAAAAPAGVRAISNTQRVQARRPDGELPPVEAKKVLVIGSGGLSIGQAGEFDYSGSQAIKTFKDEGLETIILNPNIATIQTSEELADVVYFLPVTPEYIEYVIEKEQPDSITFSFGGQSALNCGVALFRAGVLQKHNVQVLGTPIPTLELTEDRQLFADALTSINIPVARSVAVDSVEACVKSANDIGYPVIIRSAYALGGLGSGFANNDAELKRLASQALSLSPQVLVERSMKGWKEVEYEVVRDRFDNCVTICNMENFDPLGTHTGDSIVVAPSQTLSDEEYHMLRTAAIKIVKHLGVIGECNVQYALSPDSLDYAVIEVNARLSRSSALASKATGYPLAAIAARLGLGARLSDVTNAVNAQSTANFEPSLDYIVTKIPRWDLAKFREVSRRVGSSMKSVGEVMAIGRTFEESLQKAIRMVDPSFPGIQGITAATSTAKLASISDQDLIEKLGKPEDTRIFAVMEALLTQRMSVDELHAVTAIDKFFLHKIDNICETRRNLIAAKDQAPAEREALLRQAKQEGFSDEQIAKLLDVSALAVRAERKSFGIVPHIKRIDTLAAEYPAETNYLYMTYDAQDNDAFKPVAPEKKKIIVLGSGVYRIGSSVEFDWCGVQCIRSLNAQGFHTIVVNYNPETVSTDFDESDSLYFEELSFERVLDIYEFEKADGIILSVGGQLPQNIAMSLAEAGCNVIGTHPRDVDRAENRAKFSAILDENGIDQPKWESLTTRKSAHAFAEDIGFPVLIRPSYVLSGAAMNVAWSKTQLDFFLDKAAHISPEYPVVITEFIQGAQELDIDGVGYDGKLVRFAVSQHVENAGVHSGDATLVLPPLEKGDGWAARELQDGVIDACEGIASELARAFNISGPFNLQAIYQKTGDATFKLKVIECNIRASRSFPFVSKVLNTNFIHLATEAMVAKAMGTPFAAAERPENLMKISRGFKAVKVPIFSWTRLAGADPVLGVEMASTGEVACFGRDVEEALWVGLASNHNNQMRLPPAPGSTYLLSMDENTDAAHAAAIVASMTAQGFRVLADSPATQAKLHARLPAPDADAVQLLLEGEPSWDRVKQAINDHAVVAIVSLGRSTAAQMAESGDAQAQWTCTVRRAAVDLGLGLLNDAHVAELFFKATQRYGAKTNPRLNRESVKSWSEWRAT
ncbi:carbamoyl-phosphate synthase [Caulochytrium protostelioides]|uniref:Carbamoyl phosphate synthase arginine-specific large chain n=1 Tax=Caulochytrium protostelioides TaxID=1555241 RepID=A0A4P9X0F4_9FUNG|nr:carbamoyl-phosphate synthase [Caulochytrium protostelioides]